MTGKLITLEGGEGVGKSTQARRLAEALRTKGLDVVLTREPGGSPGAEAIRTLLLEGEGDRWSARAEAALFAAARADHIEKTIRPALDRGAWVICDRFLDSSRAYQGVAGGVGDAMILDLHQSCSGGFMPDRTLVLDLAEGDAVTRADERDGGVADRIGGRDAIFHHNVVGAFRAFAEQDPQRIRLIDASGVEAEVTARLLDALAGL